MHPLKTLNLSSCLSWMIWEMIWERDLAVLLCERSLDKYLVCFWYFISLRCKQIYACKRHEWISAHTYKLERKGMTNFCFSTFTHSNTKSKLVTSIFGHSTKLWGRKTWTQNILVWFLSSNGNSQIGQCQALIILRRVIFNLTIIFTVVIERLNVQAIYHHTTSPTSVFLFRGYFERGLASGVSSLYH